MNDLVAFAVYAHGGLQRWQSASAVAAVVDSHGPFWAVKGNGKLLGPCEVRASAKRQHISLRSRESGRTLEFDAALDRVIVTSDGGQIVEQLDHPRASMEGFDRDTRWTPAQVGYFVGYGIWTYLMEPFLLTWPGVITRELEPWSELGETWRRLEVNFPQSLATHERRYVYYFDARTGLQRRIDYAPEVNGGTQASHYTYEHRFADGFPFPSERRVLVRDPNGIADRHQTAILQNVSAFRFVD